MRSKKEERLGLENLNNQGCLMKIVEYNSQKDMIVEFQDKYKYKTKVSFPQFQNGQIKNVYFPSVYNIGVIGSKYPSRINGRITKEYNCWYSMLKRCYDKNFHKKEPTYLQCKVCEEWLCFENFYEWLHGQENFDILLINNDLNLDKDILIKGNKIYSPDTCCLVPHCINMLFVKSNNIRGDLPIGVRQQKNDNRFEAYYSYMNKFHYLGRYNTSQDAFYAYRKSKENLIKKVAQEEFDKSNITKKCYDAMMNYQVEVTD